MKVNQEVFFSAESKAQLESNQLADFDSLWNLEKEWFEEPNQRKDGFSGVITHELEVEDGQSRRVFIKRQENYTTGSIARPFKGMPTFEREYTNIVRLAALGVPAIELVYFATAEYNGRQCAILVSYALDEYVPVARWIKHL